MLLFLFINLKKDCACVYVCVCAHARAPHVRRCLEKQEEVLDSLELRLQVAVSNQMQVLGIELWLSGRAASAPNS